jgi:hypothetical protein
MLASVVAFALGSGFSHPFALASRFLLASLVTFARPRLPVVEPFVASVGITAADAGVPVTDVGLSWVRVD